MSSIRIASRYAKSLLDLAKETNKVEQIKTDFALFSDALKSRDLQLLIKSPIIKPDKKLSIFKAIFDGKIDELTSLFFDIVIKKGREALLPDIASAFLEQYNKLNKITTAIITTAKEVSEDVITDIKKSIPSMGGTTENVVVTKKIDPSIIGGYILQVGDKLIDASVKASLAKVQQEIVDKTYIKSCLLYTSPSPRDRQKSRMPSSA